MDAFGVGRVIGIIIGFIGALWLVGWIGKKIKGTDDKDDKDDKGEPPTPPATHDHTNSHTNITTRKGSYYE